MFTSFSTSHVVIIRLQHVGCRPEEVKLVFSSVVPFSQLVRAFIKGFPVKGIYALPVFVHGGTQQYDGAFVSDGFLRALSEVLHVLHYEKEFVVLLFGSSYSVPSIGINFVTATH